MLSTSAHTSDLLSHTRVLNDLKSVHPNGQPSSSSAAAGSAVASSSHASAYTAFDDLLASYRMPPPGPDYYRARRQLWLTPRPNRKRDLSRIDHASSARARLEKVFESPSAVYSDISWKNGIEKVWKGLCKGDRLKYRLPMNLIIKVVQASWVRDDTWPQGLEAPEPDDELPNDVPSPPIVLERIQSLSELPHPS